MECRLQVKKIGPEQFGVFEPLKSEDTYAFYFNQLCLVFGRLLEVFTNRAIQSSRPSHEMQTIAMFLEKMLYTIRVLRLKYTYNPHLGMKVDLDESGFPSYIDIEGLMTDLRLRDDYLANSSPIATLKQKLLDYMFEHGEESEDLLWRASERAYYRTLDYTKLMLTFTPGILELIKENETHRTYTISWACYNSETNRPYIWMMVFDQDIDSEPLENRAENYRDFLGVVKAEGSRAPSIKIVALAIDQAFEDIHPKELKRICVGPLCTLGFSKKPEDICELLKEHGETEQDFVIPFEEEIIISSSQRIVKGMLQLGKGKVREIFSVPGADMECYQRQASVVSQYMILPHYLLQNMTDEQRYAYRRKIMIPYDMEGGIYECTVASEDRSVPA